MTEHLDLRKILSEVRLDRPDMPSQVNVTERQVLKFIAANCLPEAKTVVDLGSGAGSAAVAMAEGFLDSRNQFPTIYAFDWFSIGAGHYATSKFKAISSQSDPSFIEDFKYFMHPYLENVEIYSGDIKLFSWLNGNIDLLFVDLCKDLDIFKHVAKTFFGSLGSGSYLVHQDFSRPRLPWLHYGAGAMSECITPIARTGGSVFYRVTKTPDQSLINMLATDSLSVTEKKKLARLGIENARNVPAVASDHFQCLAEFTDIYIDYWFTNRIVARSRYLESPSKGLFDKFYPELISEIAPA